MASSLISFAYDEECQNNVSALDVRLSSVEWIISNDFISRLGAYFQEGLTRRVTEQAAAEARKAIDELNEESRRKCALFKFSIAAESPLLVLPHRTGRDDGRPVDCLVLDLGQISIANRFDLSEHEHEFIGTGADEDVLVSRVPIESVTVTVNALNLMRTVMTERTSVTKTIPACSKMLKDATISVRVSQPLADNNVSPPLEGVI